MTMFEIFCFNSSFQVYFWLADLRIFKRGDKLEMLMTRYFEFSWRQGDDWINDPLDRILNVIDDQNALFIFLPNFAKLFLIPEIFAVN